MGAAEAIAPMSVEDYLRWEEAQGAKHEYIDGLVYAMAGTSVRHATIALNVASALRQQLRGTPCRTFVADVKVHTRVSMKDIFYYPDVFVACDPKDRHDYYRDHPKLVVEVLSPSTRRTDQQEKPRTYQGMASVEQVLLIEQDLPRCVLYNRAESDWQTDTLEGLEATLELSCIDFSLPLSVVYEDIDFQAEAE
jgi:Uma2 family endonuclease